jgi:hypothetical protein
MIVGYGMQQSLDEKVVDVDADIIVIERQINWPLKGQTVGLLTFTNNVYSFGSFAVEEYRPPLL